MKSALLVVLFPVISLAQAVQVSGAKCESTDVVVEVVSSKVSSRVLRGELSCAGDYYGAARRQLPEKRTMVAGFDVEGKQRIAIEVGHDYDCEARQNDEDVARSIVLQGATGTKFSVSVEPKNGQYRIRSQRAIAADAKKFQNEIKRATPDCPLLLKVTKEGKLISHILKCEQFD